MTNSDWFLDKGYLHRICEDYVVAGPGFVIVSDGCSSSKNTDVGARILCMRAKELIERMFSINKEHPMIDRDGNDYEFIRSRIMDQDTMSFIKTLNLPLTCLDATLLIAFVDEDKVKFFLYGDGYIAIIKKDGSKHYWKFHYPKNAPYYLSYVLDKERQKSYFCEIGEDLTVSKYSPTDASLEDWSDEDISLNRPLDNSILDPISCALREVSSFLIMSDGVGSFIDKNNAGTALSDIEILNKITDFKMLQGEFIRRRMNALFKDLARKNILHYDDIAIGGISL